MQSYYFFVKIRNKFKNKLYFCINFSRKLMRRLLFTVVTLCAATMFFSTGCTDKRPSGNDTLSDSLVIDSIQPDSMEALIEDAPMPKTADELFDDFIFNFAANRKLQRERTDFPFPVTSYGKQSTIDKDKWSIERFFMRQGYYTLIFNSMQQLSLCKDTAVSSASIEKINFAKRQIQEWQFNRVNGLWRLQGMTISSLKSHPDASFLNFYERFATDSAFQYNSLAELVNVTCPDPDDDFSTMSGDVMPEQWPAFAPWMPSGTLYNIHYGKEPYKKSSTRVFVIRGIANGLETELTFKRNGNSWMLVKMES